MQRKKKIYIAGKVTGCKYTELTFKFGEAEQLWKSKGYEPIVPINLIDQDTPWNDAMKVCFEQIANCDAVYMLNDWQDSTGAKLEHTKALELGIEVIYQPAKKMSNE